MIRVILGLMLVLGVAACSPPPLAVSYFDTPSVAVSSASYAGKSAWHVVRENRALSVPNDFKQITLPKPVGGDGVVYGVVPWTAYQYHEKHKSLGVLTGANMTDLVAFQAMYRDDAEARSYFRICAPVGRLRSGAVEMMALSRATDFGLYYRSCEWALVILPPEAERGRVL